MKLVKCVIHHGSYNFQVYCKMGEVIEETNSVLLGFKDKLPVITNPEPNCNKSLGGLNKKILKVQVDPSTGEKFINLNGRKLKMVPESFTKSQLNVATQKSVGIKSAKNIIIRKLPNMTNSLQKLQTIRIESPGNLSKISNMQNGSKLSILKQTNVLTLKNPNTDKDRKCIIDNNLVKEIRADNTVKSFKHTDSSDVNSLLTCSVIQSNLSNMKFYQNEKAVQTLELTATQRRTALKDVGIQTDEISLSNFADKDLEDLDFDAILGLEFEQPGLLTNCVNPYQVNPPEPSVLATKFFSELRQARCPNNEGHMWVYLIYLCNVFDHGFLLF